MPEGRRSRSSRCDVVSVMSRPSCAYGLKDYGRNYHDLKGIASLEGMTTASDSQAAAQWQVCKLVDELDIQITAHVRELAARVGLTVAQASALRELTGPMTLSELAVRMSCEPSNATVVIDKLESQQLIERRPNPSDRRA